MDIFGISIFVIVFGLAGYIWKLRKQITTVIPGKTDDKIVDTVEGICEEYGLNPDEIAKKSRGKLKKEIFK